MDSSDGPKCTCGHVCAFHVEFHDERPCSVGNCPCLSFGLQAVLRIVSTVVQSGGVKVTSTLEEFTPNPFKHLEEEVTRPVLPMPSSQLEVWARMVTLAKRGRE